MEQLETEEDAAALAVLLEANGYSSTEGVLASRLAQITTLEMFLQDYPKMLALCCFSALTQLRLIDQRIEKIEGLQGCRHLKKLWLIENRISVIENLQPCTALQELYLTSNRITEIGGLAHLTNLQVLWLADNYISSITGLSQLSSLQQLNLARNDISLVGSSLQPCSRLTSLNLSDNRISNMQDVVAGLSSLTSLQELCCADPFWGDCPVTSLSNYQTFMLAHLPQLASLDTLVLAPETEAAASATFAKKQLYYSMRTRTLSRALGDVCRQAQAVQQAEARRWLEVYASLSQAIQCLQEQDQDGCAGADHAQLQGLQDCQQAVAQHMTSKQQLVEQNVRAAKAGLQVAKSRLQLELSSAGNVWLEQGWPEDEWVQSCRELLRSKCRSGSSSSKARDEAGQLQVVTATRIHNRHLRAQFAQQLQAGGDSEYLFMCNPAVDVLSVAQHGFTGPQQSGGSSAATRLSNFLQPQDKAVPSGSTMQVLVCRAVLVGPCKALPDAGNLEANTGLPDGFDPLQVPGLQAAYQNVTSGGVSGSGSSNGRTGAGTKSSSGRPQDRVWIVFDNTALLPEYIATVQFAAAQPQEAAAQQAQGSSSSSSNGVQGSGSRDALLRLCIQPLSHWLHTASQCVALPAVEQELQRRCAAALVCFQLPPRPCLRQLTLHGLTEVAGGKQLNCLTRLFLGGCGLPSVGGLLQHLPAVQCLSLPCNRLTTLEGLGKSAANNSLAELDVSHNLISTWDGSWLGDCTGLTALDASCNTCVQPADLQPLVRSAPQLRQLDLRFNPVQQHKAYRLGLSALTCLTQMDGCPVQQGQQAAAGCLSPALLKDAATLWHSSSGPVPSLHTLGAADWRQSLHSVVLEGQGLRSLQGLGSACNLVSLSLGDNLISDLAGVSACSCLQRLDVSNNLVVELDALSQLVSLQQLDVSCNHISDLQALSGMTSLSQLSCEGNSISSLAPVSSLSGLVELYAAHNSLADIKEAERLCVLPRLVVLDLVGNPLVLATEGYRLLLLYKLGCLKVLDGIAADAAELAAAQAQHAGRLTRSMLEEHLGASCVLSSLRQLDLSQVGLRDLGAVFAAGGPLSALTGLVLDGNHLTSLAPLAGLTRLVALSLNSNRNLDGSPVSWCFAVPAPESPTAGTPAGTASSSLAPPQPLLPSLQTLQLAGCGLTSLVPLQLHCLPALRSLFVQGNELSRLEGLEGLEGLVALRELVADKNRLRVLEPEALSSLVRLQELRLDDNAIRSIAPAPTVVGGVGACLPQLRVLTLGNNRLMDAAECGRRVAEVPMLVEVAVAGNPFVRKQPYRHLLIGQCSQLQAIDGQPVTAEERECAEAAAAAAAGSNSVDSPRFALDVPQYTAQMLLAAAASASEARSAHAGAPVSPLARLPTVTAHGSATELPSPKMAYAYGGGSSQQQGLAAMLSYKGLANLAAARQALLLSGLGQAGGLPGLLPSSVPSIQSGVLVLTGPASFGLEGTAMRGSSGGAAAAAASAAGGGGGSPAGSPGNAAARSQMQQAQSSPGGSTARGGSRRTTTGSIASYRAGGFVVRQATFNH